MEIGGQKLVSSHLVEMESQKVISQVAEPPVLPA